MTIIKGLPARVKRFALSGLFGFMTFSGIFSGILFGAFIGARAEIIEAAADHYVLKQEMRSELPPAQLWQRLIDPARWWHPDHTYSGSSENLSLDLQAGGLWREDWDGGSVAHGEIVFVDPGKVLRMDAPFGPLQATGAKTIWTISIKPDGEGSLVTFDEIALGSDISKLDELAPAVDFVKNEAIRRLTGSGQN